ncbi:Arylsulfatase [Lunatimonas lonarensis]|uniref:Arylsulfatase n=1 Tax=Lunatimonas lonarensis TaxID=1232681 RepID=R7ZT11_9BACT|nr:arylsulfatase [Lunatimonas lonarensis]EON77124.1 Arylsulfatase [Lunatimonas lonarensis]
MNRLIPFHHLLGVFLIFLLPACGINGRIDTKPSKPNIVFIFADDMGYGDIRSLNAGSKINTPNLDKMVSEGMYFTQAHASASVCTPSRYGLLTGRYGFRSDAAAYGITGFSGPVVEEGRETLATLLKRAGYHTGIVGKWHLGLEWQTRDGLPARLDTETGFSNIEYAKPVQWGPSNVGFDESFIHPASLDMPPYVFLRNHEVVNPDVVLSSSVYPRRKEGTVLSWDKKHSDDRAIYWEKGVWWRDGEMSTDFLFEACQPTLLDEGIDFIARHTSRGAVEPFFLYLPLTGPHTPWLPSQANQGRSKAGVYGDFVLDIDFLVGKIMEVLEEQGIADQTLLIFASDNGAYWPESEVDLFSHDANGGRRGQKGDVWDGGHRIPLIVRWPEVVQKGRSSDALISLTDWMATFADMLQVATGEVYGEDSETFWPLLSGTSNEGTRTEMVHHSSRNLYSIRSGGWKYIEGLGSGGFTDPALIAPAEGDPKGQLYNEALDVAEQENLFFKHPEIVERLSERLLQIRSR